MQPSPEKKKDKKNKKQKRREKKPKRDKLDAERAKSQSRSEESKRKKKEKVKDEKPKHWREKEERPQNNDIRNKEVPSDKDNNESQRAENNKVVKTCENFDSGTVDKDISVGRADEQDKADDNCRAVKQVESGAITGDTSKSKEQDISRHSTVPSSQPFPTAPPPLSTASSRETLSIPSSPPEQDSRPLKKRKARRPSWTKLVHRAQKAENHEATLDSQRNPSKSSPQNPKTSLNAKPTDESHGVSSSSVTNSSSPLPTVTRSPSPKQSHPNPAPTQYASKNLVTPTRKRGRPKSQTSVLNEPPLKLSPNTAPTAVCLLGQDRAQKAPISVQQSAIQATPSPRKRGRPPKRPLLDNCSRDALNQSDHEDRRKDMPVSEKGHRQLKIRRLINEMKKRKKRRLHKVMSSGFVAKAADAKSIEATTVHTLSALSTSFGGKLGPQINVSKRGTIYMGKRRGRKPKAQTAHNSQSSTQSSLFTSGHETSLFSCNQTQPASSHPFPSPSLTHSSGAQSPYSEGSLTDPAPCLLFSQPFSLPSPSSSCTSPRPPSSSSLSSFVRKSCPCQGRQFFPFHQSTCKLSSPAGLHHTPGSPGHLKEATPSPRSESHSEETLPSDSGIGTDNNSISERGEMRGTRGMLRLNHRTGLFLGGQRHPTSIMDRPSPVSPPLSHMSRHTTPNSSERQRQTDRHRHRRRDCDCSSSYTCLCTCSGHNKCTHSDFYSYHGHNALKRQKNKHKKKHQQHLHLQDPEFLSELEDLVVQFNEMHIGRRSWARSGLGQGYEGGAPGGRRHHSSHSMRSNIFRINLNGFYSPHPSTYPPNPSFPPQPFYTCHPVHCNRKADRRQCGCSPKFQDTIENMGFYSSYPPATSLYHHLPNSYALASPSQYAPHQPQHFFLNPARFHRRRNRLLREGVIGGGELDSAGGSPHHGSGLRSSFSCGCGRSEHKHKHKHRHRHCERDIDEEEELIEEEVEGEGLISKQRSGFIYRQGEVGRKPSRGLGSVLSKESPWLRENGGDAFSSATPSSLTERFKLTPLTSMGLGSTHLSSFGGGWGGLGQSWTKYSGLGGSVFGNSSWTVFNGEQQRTSKTVGTGGEDEDEEDDQESPFYRTSPPPVHTNLFTSAAMATGVRGLKSGLSSRSQGGGGDRLWRRDEPAWIERREAGLQVNSRNWGQQKIVPPPDNVAVTNKRRPGRPRKYPLPSDESPAHTPSTVMSPPKLLPGLSRDGTEAEERRDARAESHQQMSEVELQAKRKKGRKRKHNSSPCHQSVTEDKPECDTPTECSSHSDEDQAPSQPVTIPKEERSDRPPWKTFLRAGLYSDDYKTTDPPSYNQQSARESMEYTPGEQEYSLLPAPMHVGKYLRLKRIHFQLPYDVMWLWQHNKLCRLPAVPLKRKRRYCRLKDKALSSPLNVDDNCGDITSLFPHLDMDLLTSSERSFVVKHQVFLLRNWELVRDRQIRLRIERERQRDAEEEEEVEDRAGDDSHIKSDQPVGEEVVVIRSDPHKSQDTSSFLTTCPIKTQNRKEQKEEDKRGEEEVCREQRRKRLSDLLLTLQHS